MNNIEQTNEKHPILEWWYKLDIKERRRVWDKYTLDKEFILPIFIPDRRELINMYQKEVMPVDRLYKWWYSLGDSRRDELWNKYVPSSVKLREPLYEDLVYIYEKSKNRIESTTKLTSKDWWDGLSSSIQGKLIAKYFTLTHYDDMLLKCVVEYLYQKTYLGEPIPNLVTIFDKFNIKSKICNIFVTSIRPRKVCVEDTPLEKPKYQTWWESLDNDTRKGLRHEHLPNSVSIILKDLESVPLYEQEYIYNQLGIGQRKVEESMFDGDLLRKCCQEFNSLTHFHDRNSDKFLQFLLKKNKS